MRVTNVVLYSNDTEMISFAVGLGESQTRYLLKKWVGIDAEDLVPRFYAFGQQTRTGFFDIGMKPRDIVMRLVLNPNFKLDETYSEVRDQMYRAISANRTGVITMHLRSGASTVAKISGFITKFEVDHMTNLPEVQITLRCDNPMFRGINPVQFTGADFPTSPLNIVDSLSTAPHGFAFVLEFTDDVDYLSILESASSPDWSFITVPSGGFLTGDVLYFSSDTSNKYLYIDRSSTIIPIIDTITPNSVWPLMFPGSNNVFILEYAFTDLISLEYYPAYWGV